MRVRLLHKYVTLSHHLGLDSFEQELQSGPVHLARLEAAPVGQEPSLFQALGPDAKAAAVPVEHLDLVGPAIEKDKELPGERLCVATHSRSYVAKLNM